MKRQSYWMGFGTILIALLVWLAFFWEPGNTDPQDTAEPASLSQTISQAGKPDGGDFVLSSPDGRRSLQDYRGKVVVMFFGYTFCPDVCPTSLSSIGAAFSKLAPDQQAKVQGIFVSVDPERDTQEILKTYAPFFHANIVGMTGTQEELAVVARQYGAVYMKQMSLDGRPYSVDHTSSIFIIAPDGRLAEVLPHGTSIEVIVNTIRRQLDPQKN